MIAHRAGGDPSLFANGGDGPPSSRSRQKSPLLARPSVHRKITISTSPQKPRPTPEPGSTASRGTETTPSTSGRKQRQQGPQQTSRMQNKSSRDAGVIRRRRAPTPLPQLPSPSPPSPRPTPTKSGCHGRRLIPPARTGGCKAAPTPTTCSPGSRRCCSSFARLVHLWMLFVNVAYNTL